MFNRSKLGCARVFERNDGGVIENEVPFSQIYRPNQKEVIIISVALSPKDYKSIRYILFYWEIG